MSVYFTFIDTSGQLTIRLSSEWNLEQLSSRLTPVYAVILGFIATLLAYLGAGPYWQNIQDLSMVCRYNWWNNLLYINNYVLTYPSEVDTILNIC